MGKGDVDGVTCREKQSEREGDRESGSCNLSVSLALLPRTCWQLKLKFYAKLSSKHRMAITATGLRPPSPLTVTSAVILSTLRLVTLDMSLTFILALLRSWQCRGRQLKLLTCMLCHAQCQSSQSLRNECTPSVIHEYSNMQYILHSAFYAYDINIHQTFASNVIWVASH